MLDRILANWPLKLLSIAMAVILWFYVLGSKDPQTTQAISVPVVTVNTPQGLEAIDVTPTSVELRVRGRASALAHTEVGNIRMEANLRNAQVGENELPLRVAGLPLNLTVIPGYPGTATVRLDTVIERQRPVDYERRGDPAEGFIVEEITVEPGEVTVRGATSRVGGVIRAVVIVDISGLNTSMSFEADLEARDHRDETVSGVTFKPSMVTVDVKVRQVNVRSVPVRPVLGSPPPGYTVTRVSVSPVVVTITGDEGLEAVQSVSTLLVDISGLRGSKTYTVPLSVPTGLSVLGAASVTVSVTTARVPTAPEDPAPPETPRNDEEEPEEEIEPPTVNENDDPAAVDDETAGNDSEEVPGAAESGRSRGERDSSASTPASSRSAG